MPVVTASSSDKDIKISISQAESTPGVTVVRFNKDGVFKTYMITYSPGAVITPQKEGKAYAEADKAAGDVVELGKLKDLVAADKWDGDWEMWINVATGPNLSAVNFGTNTQAGLVISDGTDYIRLNTRRQSATQVGAGAGWSIREDDQRHEQELQRRSQSVLPANRQDRRYIAGVQLHQRQHQHKLG